MLYWTQWQDDCGRSGHGGDDSATVTASFNTPSEEFSSSEGVRGSQSLFGQLQQLMDRSSLIVDLTSYVPSPLSNIRIWLQLQWTIMLDQLSLYSMLGLVQEGYSARVSLFNPYSGETRAEHRQMFSFYSVDTGKAYNPVTEAWECMSPQSQCGRCGKCEVERRKTMNKDAWKLQGACFTVPFMHMGKAIVWRYVVSLWQLVLTLDAQEALTAGTADCHCLESCLKGEPRACTFLDGTVNAGNRLEIDAGDGGSHREAFEGLKGNRDFGPLLKLLEGREHLLAALPLEEQGKWDAAGATLLSFINLVWKRGCYEDHQRWEAIGLAYQYLWQMMACVPVERFNNYMLMLAQWPFFQPDPSKTGIVDGSARYVDEAVCLLQRRPIKLDSDEHTEAMHRVVKRITSNQGGGRAAVSQTRSHEGGTKAVTRDVSGLQHRVDTCSIRDLEVLQPIVQPKERARSERYASLPASDKRFTVQEALESLEAILDVKYQTKAEGGVGKIVVQTMARESGLKKKQSALAKQQSKWKSAVTMTGGYCGRLGVAGHQQL
eukprot:gene7985-8185_t